MNATANTFWRRLRASWLDASLTGLGVLLGLPSLLYPFGRDQGLYYYVAREWLLRGQIPYRDVLDHKTPGIYVLHAIAIFSFGETQWGIRVLDLLGVVTFGLLAGSLYERTGRPIAAGLRGAAVVLLAMLFYGYLDFWNTAQSELWCSGLALASVWAARRIRLGTRASFVAGVLAGAAMVVKPPALPMLLVGFGALLWRAHSEAAFRPRPVAALVALYAAGASLVLLIVLGYFGVEHALPAMRDIVVGANAYYVKHEAGAPPGTGWTDYAAFPLQYYAPFTTIFPLGMVAAMWAGKHRKDRDALERAVLAVALFAASLGSVIMQGKFYLLHWAVCLVPFALFGVVALSALQHVLPRVWAPRVGALLVVLGYASTGQFRWQTDTVVAEVAYLRGHLDRAGLHARFQMPVFGFAYDDSYRIGHWLKDHTTPADNVTVRGFSAEVYAVAERRHIGRFFWTVFLTSPSRAYRRAEWLAEDERDLCEHPPKYVVVTTQAHEGPDSAEWFARLGYRSVHVDGPFTVLGR